MDELIPSVAERVCTFTLALQNVVCGALLRAVVLYPESNLQQQQQRRGEDEQVWEGHKVVLVSGGLPLRRRRGAVRRRRLRCGRGYVGTCRATENSSGATRI
jgi:hypothetical protein